MDAIQSLTNELAFLQVGLLGKLLLAALLGGVIGWEREASDKPAGLRTNLLICVGAALLSHVSIHFATVTYDGSWIRADPTRIAAQIVSGIGFLGAGTIIQARGSVTGLTTAATLWVVAAIGMAVGGESFVAAVGATILVLVALVPLGWLESWVASHRSEGRSWRVVTSLREGVVDELEELLRERGMRPRVEKVEKDVEAGRLVVYLGSEGKDDDFSGARRALLARDDVMELTVLAVAPSS